MAKILVVHNNEHDRLEYLRPKLDQLVRTLANAGQKFVVEFVGPEVDLIRENRSRDTVWNWIRRAFRASWMFSISDPKHSPLRRESVFGYLNHIFYYLFAYPRSIKIEQEVLYAHAFCWRECMQTGEPVMVLESDAIFHAHTSSGLSSLMIYLQTSAPNDRYYVDLAGGYDRKKIANSWCFEEAYGCTNIVVGGDPELTLHILPRLATNTVGGYLLSPSLAADLFAFVHKVRPLLPPDWAINFFAGQNMNKRALCIHTSPTLFTQGSAEGIYKSTIEGARLRQ